MEASKAVLSTFGWKFCLQCWILVKSNDLIINSKLENLFFPHGNISLNLA